MRSRTKVGGSASSSSSSCSPSSGMGSAAAAAAAVSSASILPTTTKARVGDVFQKKESTAMILNLRRQRMILVLICVVQAVVIIDAKTNGGGRILSFIFSFSSLQSSQTTKCQIDLGQYKGPVYNSPESGTVGPPNCLLSSKWMQVSLHTVQFPGSNDKFDDWMWIDYHDRVNVVVEDEPSSSSSSTSGNEDEEERRFLVFEQTKYALEGRTSLAIIGGIIEPGEQPEHAARREVYEEMDGLECQQFHFLGRYRTDVNRGMGWLNSFLATNCSRKRTTTSTDSHKKILVAAGEEQQQEEEVGAADSEKQKLKSISLSEFRQAAHDGRFLEVQWTTTVAQALLHPELAGEK
mmetsp:Transcript_43667/g.105887  ORF Transcript_43667/g.105887 Transcript_43667/m.105887 type:complete len:350 (-) Transcript_43667:475-1524(-)|eukprot:CAMPEP_0113494354 /NCGR_PEP_ID=MMETSP0014_2-20120614/29062_1 /TAXON_ID=2857 /ORGANISM="Nitzschia sp." /LENGTH=349 /DNA_ID=CAMNT_0000388241 /DNA_START=177 /DNA_END=1226 /DNA_ORIENTATION=- /assembly_acc=CAM_ASM_000159